jgi:hypothetical protein
MLSQDHAHTELRIKEGSEIETLRKENEFLQSRLKKQEDQSKEQVQILQEKLEIQERKYNKKKTQLQQFKEDLQQQLQSYLQIQQ